MELLRVCVIGAGAAGLCATRYLTSHPDTFNTTVFEQTSSVGGTWVYNDRTGIDENGEPIHSSVYANLRTNLPKEVMAFPDFPFPSEWASFMTHQEVLWYLQDYTNHFNLQEFIHFNSAVRRVQPIKDLDSDKVTWEVVVEHVKTKESQTFMFDAVIICNGHYFVPFEPKIPGLQSFPGLIMHSHDFRYPEDFQGKSVVVLGAAASGTDISLELAKCADMVYLSHRKERCYCKLPDNIEELTPVSRVSANGIVFFEDGKERKADVILFCTGYKFSFPFLSPDCNIQVDDNRITHLYKHIFNTSHPSMAFIGMCWRICPFPLFSIQAHYIVSILQGRKKLPSVEEMNADEDRDFREKCSTGLFQRHAHVLGERQWDYCREIAHLAGCTGPSEMCEALYKHVGLRRKYFLMEYKKDEFQIKSNGEWAVKE